MTRDEILSMEAGREMDALVARRVMLLPNVAQEKQRVSWADGNGFHLVEHYSTAISDAWQVVEKMRENFYALYIAGGSLYHVAFYNSDPPPGSSDMIVHPSAPLAICRAALLAALEPHE
jgi:hypothetical protein